MSDLREIAQFWARDRSDYACDAARLAVDWLRQRVRVAGLEVEVERLKQERTDVIEIVDKLEQAERERDEARQKAAAWDLLDSLLQRECASVQIYHHNPEFDGPNNVVTYRYLFDGSEIDYRGESVVDCLRQIKADILGEQEKTNE